MPTFSLRPRLAWIVLLLALLPLPTVHAAKPTPAGGSELMVESPGGRDVSAADCGVFINGKPAPAARGDVNALFSTDPEREREVWSAGAAEEPTTFAYRIAFAKPVAIGAVLLRGTPQKVAVLKPDAPFPGDPSNPEQWLTVSVPPRQSSRSLVPLAAATTTRAVLLIDTRDQGVSEVKSLRLITRRLFNATPLGQAYGDAEWTMYPFMGSPVTYAASNLVNGQGHWQNHGPNKENRVTTPDVSDINPSWFILAWEQKQTVSGLWMRDNFEKFETDIFVGLDTVNPRTGTEAEWKRVRPTGTTREAGGRLLAFTPMQTRGIRFRITQTSDPTIAGKLSAVHALCDLGDAPIPTTPASVDAPAPVQVQYTLDFDGEVSVVINRADGTRVRNLVTRAQRRKGAQSEPWDLKDDQGRQVPPGDYGWQVLAHPPLELRYEMTPYPNVQNFFEDRAPWPTGASGSGGWATNHTAPSSVAAVEDNVYIGSYVSEGGSALLEADLQGKKSWGTGNFTAWTGPQFLAGEGKTIYAQARTVGSDVDCVYAIDRATHKITTPLSLRPTATRNRRVVGMAVRDGKITLSSFSTPQWFDDAAQAADVDFSYCWPKLPEKRKERVPHEIVPDPRTDWLRLFRLTGTPPGQARENDTFLHSVESTHGSGPRQYVVLAFRRPIPVGSVVFPQSSEKNVEVRLSYLNTDATLPANPGDPKLWTPFEHQAKRAWDVATPGPNVFTRAIRIAFVKGGDDLFTDGDDSASFIADEKSLDSGAKKGAVLGDGKDWAGRLEGMKILRRRYANVAGEATVTVNSGSVSPEGAWDAKRREPLSPENPGIYLMQWKAAQKLRGLAFREIDGKRAEIDVYTGPEGGTIDMNSQENWEKVADYTQARRKHHWGGGNLTEMYARYVDGYADFGREVETRAVRIRVVEQWTETGQNPQYGLRADQGGMTLDTARCRIFGVAAMKYLGGEQAVDPIMDERIETFSAASGDLVSEVKIDRPGPIAYGPDGTLYALSLKRVVRVDAGGNHTPIISDLESPKALAIDASGNFYLFDSGPKRQCIRVYDKAGKFLRTIGEEGGRVTGPWNTLRMMNVTALAVDKLGQVWATEDNFNPKRVVQWGPDGKFIKEVLGPTEYGGGGTLDPWDKSRFFYEQMEFAIDWTTGKTSLKSWHTTDKVCGELPIHIGDRVYLVNRPTGSRAQMNVGVVYLLENGRSRPVAAMGSSEDYPPLKSPTVRKAIGRPILKGTRFLWSDLNGDGAIQSDEVRITDMPGERPMMSVSNFENDLSTNSGTLRYQVTKLLPNGTPVYDEVELPLQRSQQFSAYATTRLDNGSFVAMGSNGKAAAVKADGSLLWTYPTEGCGVHALYSAGPWTPRQVVAEFAWVGHETAHAGDLGEFLVTSGNVGTWNIWTADGILAGQIFRDQRDPRRQAWSMNEASRGMVLKDITLGQEHFQGHFMRSRSDNRYYAVAGHIHAGVVEVVGMDRFKRIKGVASVTPQLLVAAAEWDRVKQKTEVYKRSPVIDLYRLKALPILNDFESEWGFSSASIDDDIKFSIGYSDTDLYVRYIVRNHGPMKNTGDQWDKLFKTGASVDLQIGTDPSAPDDRKSPAPGDTRVLMTIANGKPVAVLYQPVVPGTPEDKTWKVVSPVASISIDRVEPLQGAKIFARELSDDGDPGYILQASIPLASIGLKPAPGMRLRMDWGVLSSGKDGNEVLRRVYWANKATAIVSDAPSEAALYPALWGHVRIQGQQGSGDKAPTNPLLDKKNGATNKQVDELLDDMDNDRK